MDLNDLNNIQQSTCCWDMVGMRSNSQKKYHLFDIKLVRYRPQSVLQIALASLYISSKTYLFLRYGLFLAFVFLHPQFFSPIIYQFIFHEHKLKQPDNSKNDYIRVRVEGGNLPVIKHDQTLSSDQSWSCISLQYLRAYWSM